jgi:hypothetical protein
MPGATARSRHNASFSLLETRAPADRALMSAPEMRGPEEQDSWLKRLDRFPANVSGQDRQVFQPSGMRFMSA